MADTSRFFSNKSKLKKEYQLQDAAERATHTLLSDTEWRLRSFKVIRHHLGGFKDDELRQILVRAGAVRFKSKSGEELWGLTSRNEDRLGVTQIDQDSANRNDRELFFSRRPMRVLLCIRPTTTFCTGNVESWKD